MKTFKTISILLIITLSISIYTNVRTEEHKAHIVSYFEHGFLDMVNCLQCAEEISEATIKGRNKK